MAGLCAALKRIRRADAQQPGRAGWTPAMVREGWAGGHAVRGPSAKTSRVAQIGAP